MCGGEEKAQSRRKCKRIGKSLAFICAETMEETWLLLVEELVN